MLANRHPEYAPTLLPFLRQISLNVIEFKDSSFSTETEDRLLQQRTNRKHDSLSLHYTDIVIGIDRHFCHGHHSTCARFFRFELFSTSFEISRHVLWSSFLLLPSLSKARRHLDRMHLKLESMQSLVVVVKLRNFIEYGPLYVSRFLIQPPVNYSDRRFPLIVLVMDWYAHHIAGIYITQQKFKQLFHTIGEMSRRFFRCRISRSVLSLRLWSSCIAD